MQQESQVKHKEMCWGLHFIKYFMVHGMGHVFVDAKLSLGN